MLNRSKIWWRLREQDLWNLTLLLHKFLLIFNVLTFYVSLRKAWLLPMILRRKVSFFPFLFLPWTHLPNTEILSILKYTVLCSDLYPPQYSYCDSTKETPYQVRVYGCRYLGGKRVWHPPDGYSRAFPTLSLSTAEGLSPSLSSWHHPTRWAQSFLPSSSQVHFFHTCITNAYIKCFGPHWWEGMW